MLFQQIGWTLLHSLWIITVLAGVYFLLHRSIPLRWARARYALGYAILLAMIGLPVVVSGEWEVRSEKQEEGTSSELAVAVEAEPGGNPELRRQLVDELKKILGRADSGQQIADNEQQLTVSDQQKEADAAPEILLPTSHSPLPTFFFPLPTFLTLLSTAWAIGVAVMSVRLLRDYFAVRALGRTARPILGGEWFESLRNLQKRLGVRQLVRLAESLQIDSPILIGMFKPVILLPLSLRTGFTPQEIEAILAHELAHIRRYDYLANLVQLLIETLLFYHPLVGWVSRSVRCDREYVCDDFVVHRTKTDRLLYAKTLTHLEQTRHTHYGESEMKNLLSTPAAAAKPLLTRIQRILELKTTERSALWPAGLILLTALAIGAVLLGGWGQMSGGNPQLPADGQAAVLATAPASEAASEDRSGYSEPQFPEKRSLPEPVPESLSADVPPMVRLEMQLRKIAVEAAIKGFLESKITEGQILDMLQQHRKAAKELAEASKPRPTGQVIEMTRSGQMAVVPLEQQSADSNRLPVLLEAAKLRMEAAAAEVEAATRAFLEGRKTEDQLLDAHRRHREAAKGLAEASRERPSTPEKEEESLIQRPYTPQQSSDSNRPVIRGYSLVRIAELLGVSGTMGGMGGSGVAYARPSRSTLDSMMPIFQDQLKRVHPQEAVTVQPVYASGGSEVSAILVIGPEKVQQSVKKLLAELEKACEEIRDTVSEEQFVIMKHQANSQQQQVPEVRPYQPVDETTAMQPQADPGRLIPVDAPRPVDATKVLPLEDGTSSQPADRAVSKPLPEPAYLPDPSWAKIRQTEAALSRVLEGDETIEAGTPLATVIKRLSEQRGLYFEFDEDELAEIEASPDTPTKQAVLVRGISAEMLLNRLLRPLDLAYCINLDGDVIITSKTAATEYSAHRLTQVYKFNSSAGAKDLEDIMMMLDDTLNADYVSVAQRDRALCIHGSYADQKQAERIIDAAFGGHKEPGM